MSERFQKTFLFYDIETSGLNKCFDQVLQFAAIRTDLELNEIERTHINIRLNPNVTLSPGALITHRIGVQQCQAGENELDAIVKIHSLLNTPGTISLGYNTLGFDDEFLRFSFYRNLLTPYTHQYENQCSRMDLYPFAVMYYLYKNNVIDWPIIDDRPSLKLEHLSQANQLTPGLAHNAMVDVEATLALTRRFIKEQDMWHYLMGYFDKKIDADRIKVLKGEAILVNGKLGSANNYQAPVLSLGQHQHYKNQTLWLRLDQEQLQHTTADNIAENTYVIRKRMGENPILLPPYERFTTTLSHERLSIAHDNKQWLESNAALLRAIQDYHQHYKYPEVPERDIDAALYDLPFPNDRDIFLMKKFHAASPKTKLEIVNQFANEHYQTLAIRLMGRHFINYLDDDSRAQYDDYIKQSRGEYANMIDFHGEKRLTPTDALKEIEALKKERQLDEEQLILLNELAKQLTLQV